MIRPDPQVQPLMEHGVNAFRLESEPLRGIQPRVARAGERAVIDLRAFGRCTSSRGQGPE